MEGDVKTAAVLVKTYRKIRAAIDDKDAEYKAELAALKGQLELVSDKLLAICNEQDVDALRTPFGSVTRRTSTRYWTNDWEAMYRFMQEEGAMHLLQQRIHTENMRQFLEENPDKLPVGLNADTKYAITVRKPTNK